MLKSTILEFLQQMQEYYGDSVPELLLSKMVVDHVDEATIASLMRTKVLPHTDLIRKRDVEALRILMSGVTGETIKVDKAHAMFIDMDQEDQEVLWEWVDTIISLAEGAK